MPRFLPTSLQQWHKDNGSEVFTAIGCRPCAWRKWGAPHFRHAQASHWIEDGLSIVEIQFLLGHEQIETTMKYLDITTDQKVKALATLESETDKKISRKWKKSDGSLTDF